MQGIFWLEIREDSARVEVALFLFFWLMTDTKATQEKISKSLDFGGGEEGRPEPRDEKFSSEESDPAESNIRSTRQVWE